MKILLIQPTKINPIGLKIIGSYLLKNNIDVEIINYSDGDKKSLIKKLSEFRPQFVGISLWTGSMILKYLEIVDIVKNNFSDIKIIAGGFHPSCLPEQVMRESNCDFVVCGDGNTAILKIINNDFLNEDGILFKKDNKIMGNTALRTDSLDLVESIFYNYPPVTYKKHWADKVVRIYTSKGCPYGCAFCYHSYIERQIRFRNLDNIKKELHLLKEKYNISNIAFYDDNFGMNKERAYEISKTLKELKIKFQFSVRIDQLNEDFIKQMKSDGCACFYLGLESGSDRMLKLINKNFNSEFVREKTRLLNKHKLPFQASFMINLPSETKEDLMKTKKLAQEIKALSLTFSLYSPFPKTKLYDYIKEHYPSVDLPATLTQWADINFFKYIENISELSMEDIKEFCKFFNVVAYKVNELHKTDI